MTNENGLQFHETRSLTVHDVLQNRFGLSVRLLNILHYETHVGDMNVNKGHGFDDGITRETSIERLARVPDSKFLRTQNMGRKALKELREFLDSRLNDKPDLLEQIDMSHDEVVRRARNEGLEESREKLAAFMLKHSMATGHGETIEDLLSELEWQIKELRK